MILYFSGTGNSRYAAQLIGEITGDNIVSMNELIKSGNKETLTSDRPFVFAAPAHGWRIPETAESFIRGASFEGSDKAYFVMTCGDDTGNAAHYSKKLCKEKNMQFMGLTSVVMPENYIALYSAPGEAEAAQIIKNAVPRIIEAAKNIKQGLPFSDRQITLTDRFKSTVINPIFRSFIISAKGFYTTEACTGCGTCARLCPVNNISLSAGKPEWGGECTHCMACICGCPNEAIEYKSKTKGKPRYYCEAYHPKG